ncbi:MAG: acetyl-CoA carboxylase biotin carboxylase subunit, partial [Rhodovibrionaceae bacterium]|nr:acetyl-CoA carboxylase biotin carboxylase subunit [Rhodovibrionaceae bacterium]
MFDRILIANRGEIACRIVRTARRLGVASVAVYSDADRDALHVRMADEAYRLGPAPAAESYLKIEAILEAAEASGARAVHPGYGFLAENAGFAEACEAAGLVFIGPPAGAIRAMGSKSEAKTIMEKAGVPLVPGYHGAEQDDSLLAEEAERIGYPVLIKASAGGGGKGMRVVERAKDFADGLQAARRESRGAFGDDQVLIEKYLTRPRHVEVQVFADGHGNNVYLFERDCSLQRRHQKVLEEAPAPGMTADRRREMGEAAVAAAEAIGYRGAGTVEFIAEGDDFYFMEMNTRLQVEHPVTEMITGQDLVEWQIRVAAGEPLPKSQEDLSISGHAFEARLYAEDPAKGFLPATGTLTRLRFPDADVHSRVDSGVSEGDEVSAHYDPMIAKIVAWDRDRTAALRRLGHALKRTEAVGVTTNRDFLIAVAEHPAFGEGAVDTGFIDRHRADLIPEQSPVPSDVLGLAALAELLYRSREATARARASGDPHSPWALANGWRLNMETHSDLVFDDAGGEVSVAVYFGRDGYRLRLPDGELEAHGEMDDDGRLSADLGGRRLEASVVRSGADITLIALGRVH